MEDFNKNQIVEVKDTATAMMVSRQAQEVQAACVIARKFPRDENEAYKRIMRACARVGLAEKAEYTFPRGDQKVAGPSIRLAESIAQNWGNLDYGVIEIDNSNGKSEMMAYAWDLETNTRVTKIFSVKHQRDTRAGTKILTDGRDIYEATANFGARRVRACILGIIPGDVIEGAVKECRKTIKGENKTPIEDRIKVMLNTFEKEFRVTTKDVETYLGYNAKSFSEADLIKMRGVYQSISDGMSTPDSYFKKDGVSAPIADPFAKKEEPKVDASQKRDKRKADDAEVVPSSEGVITVDPIMFKEMKAKFPGEENWQLEIRVREKMGVDA